MASYRRHRPGTDTEASPETAEALAAGELPADTLAPLVAEESPKQPIAVRIRLQVTLNSEDALRLDTLCKFARVPRGRVVALLIRNATPGYRAPTIPEAVRTLLRAS